MAPPTRIVMIGTGDFALPTFEHLCETGHHVVALITQPDRPQGRKQELIPSRIKLGRRARGIPVWQPEDVNAPESVDALADFEPDLLVTAAYGQILSAEAARGCRGSAASTCTARSCPAYRGAAPVARAIEHGETETGVTVILMSPRIDAGGMIKVARTPIDPDETAGELEDRLARSRRTAGRRGRSPRSTRDRARSCRRSKARVTKAPEAPQGGRPDRLVAAGRGRSTTSSAPCSPGRSASP